MAAGVKYPKLYADASDGEAGNKFNCAQRGHQNMLESYPQFLTLLILLGLVYPITSATLGAIWCVARIGYFRAYATGDPKKRLPWFGASSLSLLALIFTTIYAGLKTTGLF